MFHHSPKKEKKNKFKGLIILVIVFIGFFMVSFVKESYRNYKINKEIKKLKSEISELNNENTQMASLIDYFKTNTFAEKEARVKLGLKKPGENVFVIEKKDDQRSSDNQINQINEKDMPNYKKWWVYFFGKN